MNTNEKEFIVSVIKLVTVYGIPVAKGIITTWNTDKEPTLDQIIALRHKLPEAKTFFEEDIK